MPFPFFFFSFWPPPPPPAAGEGSKRDVHLLVQEGAALPSITRSPGSAKCNFISTRNGPRAGHRWRERVSPMQSAQRVPRLNLILPDTLRGSSLSPPSGEEKGPAEGERATGSCEPPHPHQGKRRPLGTLKSAGGGGTETPTAKTWALVGLQRARRIPEHPKLISVYLPPLGRHQ